MLPFYHNTMSIGSIIASLQLYKDMSNQLYLHTGLCNAWDIGAPVQGSERCFTSLTKASYSQAQEICREDDLRVISLDDVQHWNKTAVINYIYLVFKCSKQSECVDSRPPKNCIKPLCG